MLQQYKISGELKRDREYCPSCKFGKSFSNEQRFQTDTLSGSTYQKICGTCLTKYQIPYVPLGFEVENYPGMTINIDSFRTWEQSNDGWLNEKNQGFHTIKIALEHTKEEKKMNIEGTELVRLKDEYDRTYECPKHIWITSAPFKTSEGKFQITSCAVCKIGTIVYKGKTYQDSISNLLRFVAHMGIQAEKKAKEQQNEIDSLFDIRVYEAEKKLEEQPNFDIEEAPSFEIEDLFGNIELKAEEEPETPYSLF